MPLTAKGKEILASMEKQYGAEKGKEVFYASANKGTITGVHDGEDNGMEFDAKLDALGERCAAYDAKK